MIRYASDQEDSEEEEKILEKHEKPESLSSFVESTRKMFLLQYALEVKLGEKARLETIIKEEEARLKKEESELKLAEQAFDNFLQENDRKAMEAQKKFVFLLFSKQTVASSQPGQSRSPKLPERRTNTSRLWRRRFSS